MAACGPYADEVKVSTYCEGAVEHFDWVTDCGVPYEPTFDPEPHGRSRESDGGLVWVGENSYPFDVLAVPAPRGHRVATPGHGGWLLMEHLAKRALAVGATVRPDTTVERLVVDRDGAVIGLDARSFGHTVHIRARKGVVLTGGGFVFNDEMLGQFAPNLIGHGKIGTDGDDGSAIQMARAAGAAIKRMEAGNASLMVPPQLLLPGMLVNAVAQRFINEDTYFGRVGQHSLFHQRAETYLILDGNTYDSVPREQRMGIRPKWVCETVEELENEVGFPTGSLQASVEFYNRYAATGSDPLFHKNRRWLKPLESPFGAVDLRPRVHDNGMMQSRYWVFTLGGLHTTINGEVLSLDGAPIPGLFAAGRTTSGIQAWGYISGTSLGESTFFGRRAGRAAAKV